MSTVKFDPVFSNDPSRIERKVAEIQKTHQRMSALLSATGVTYIDRSPAETTCPYCGTYHSLPRCQSCGAPRQNRTPRPI